MASGHPFAPVIRPTKRNSKKVYFWDTLLYRYQLPFICAVTVTGTTSPSHLNPKHPKQGDNNPNKGVLTEASSIYCSVCSNPPASVVQRHIFKSGALTDATCPSSAYTYALLSTSPPCAPSPHPRAHKHNSTYELRGLTLCYCVSLNVHSCHVLQ